MLPGAFFLKGNKYFKNDVKQNIKVEEEENEGDQLNLEES
jgi:hypothetical protein